LEITNGNTLNLRIVPQLPLYEELFCERTLIFGS
jgi:hypothetical protein